MDGQDNVVIGVLQDKTVAVIFRQIFEEGEGVEVLLRLGLHRFHEHLTKRPLLLGRDLSRFRPPGLAVFEILLFQQILGAEIPIIAPDSAPAADFPRLRALIIEQINHRAFDDFVGINIVQGHGDRRIFRKISFSGCIVGILLLEII